MKSSIIIAIFILFTVVGWIGSGQFTNVKAQDESSNSTEQTKTEEKIILNNQNTNDNELNKVEVRDFTFSQIDQSIELQGQTTHNKKINVKSQTTGNIIEINFIRGNKVSKNDDLIKISMENRLELLNSSKKDLERLKKELTLNEKNKKIY